MERLAPQNDTSPSAWEKLHVTHGKIGTGHKDWKVNFASAREVLDVTISTILPSRNSASRFRSHLVPTFIHSIQPCSQNGLACPTWRTWLPSGKHARGRVRRQPHKVFSAGISSFATKVASNFQKLMTGRRPNQTVMNKSTLQNERQGYGGWNIRLLQYPKSPCWHLGNEWSVSQEPPSIFLGKGSTKSPFMPGPKLRNSTLIEQITWVCSAFSTLIGPDK